MQVSKAWWVATLVAAITLAGSAIINSSVSFFIALIPRFLLKVNSFLLSKTRLARAARYGQPLRA
jgi:hypothetical protein